MTLSAPFVIAIAFFLPLLVLIVMARVKAYRQRVALLAAEEPVLFRPAKGEPETLFEATGEVTANVLLRGFSLAQRTYLRQQYGTALTGAILSAYVLFVAASMGLLPEHIRMYASASSSQRIWRSYVDVMIDTGHLALIVAFLAGLVAASYLKVPDPALFMRTRPLSHKFLFWGRTAFVLAGILTGTLMAMSASILLLFVVYGPVWKVVSHPPASIFRLGLSMLTTTALPFSIIVFGFCLSRRDHLRGGWKLLPVLLGGSVGFVTIYLFRFPLTTQVPEMLFLFPTLASTGPLAFALVPILCAAALLWLAQHLSTAFEI